jgi:hypothetical protein
MKIRYSNFLAKLSVIIPVLCSGCGFRTPEIQEFWANENDHQIAVNAIVGQMSCEIGQALRSVYYSRDNNMGQLSFLPNWGVQVSLLLSVTEKSAVTPGVSVISPPPGAYLTNFGGTISGEADRIDTQQRLYPVTDFLKGGPRYDSGIIDRPCISKVGEPGTLFVQTDSGFRDDLFSFVKTLNTKTADEPLAGQAATVIGMSHNIKFDILTDASVNPTWKLVRVTTTSSPLFDTRRDRSQQLIITLGPLQGTGPPNKGLKTLSLAAQNAQNAQELAAYIARSLSGE